MAKEYKQSFESMGVLCVGSGCVEGEKVENAFATFSGSIIGEV